MGTDLSSLPERKR